MGGPAGRAEWFPAERKRVPGHCILAVRGAAGMNELARGLIGIGILLVVVGAVLLLAARLGLPLGRLPGDISYRGKNVGVYFPLGTCIVLSVVLSLVFYLLSRFHK